MKLDLDDIAHVLNQTDLPPGKLKEIMAELEKAAKELKAEKEAEKDAAGAGEKPYLMLVSTGGEGTPLDDMPWFAVESVGEQDHTTVVGRICEATREYNSDLLARRGKKRKKKHRREPVTTIGQAFGQVPGTFFKRKGLKVRWKEPLILVHSVDNEVPNPVPDDKPADDNDMIIAAYKSRESYQDAQPWTAEIDD